MSPSFFESICICDGKPRLLHLHQKRIRQTLQGAPGPDLAKFFARLPLPDKGLFKARVNYGCNGKILSHAIDAYSARMIRSLALVERPDLDYSVKSTDRSALEQIRLRHPEADDVIITQDGFLTDTSYSNIVLGDGTCWITPAHCLLPGVKRQYLLDTEAITTRLLRDRDIPHFPFCSLINAMLDPGEVQIPTSSILR